MTHVRIKHKIRYKVELHEFKDGAELKSRAYLHFLHGAKKKKYDVGSRGIALLQLDKIPESILHDPRKNIFGRFFFFFFVFFNAKRRF